MTATAHLGSEPQRRSLSLDGIGLMTASWSLAGGLAGGLLVVGLIVTGSIHPGGILLIAAGIAAAGSGFGTVHGAILGHLGRGEKTATGRSWGAWVTTGVMAAVALTVAVAAGVWLAMSAVAARAGSVLAWMLLAASVAVSIAIIIWATVLGWRALESAYARWPDHWLGSWLAFGTFAVLTTTFLAVRPALPGTDLRLTALGTIALAAVATLWIALPAIVVALALTRRRLLRR